MNLLSINNLISKAYTKTVENSYGFLRKEMKEKEYDKNIINEVVQN